MGCRLRKFMILRNLRMISWKRFKSASITGILLISALLITSCSSSKQFWSNITSTKTSTVSQPTTDPEVTYSTQRSNTSPLPQPKNLKPNIILIVADDLGYGDLGCYGQKDILTPHIDSLAQSGIRFKNFYAGATVCAPSRCVLMTGQHTGRAYIRGNGPHALPDETVTVAETLKEGGYNTAAIGKWGLGLQGSEGIPTKQGFDNFFGYLHQGHAHNYYPTFLVLNEETVQLENVVPDERSSGAGVATEKKQYSHDLFMDSSLSYIDLYHDKPFFLYLPLTIPHANNEAGEAGMEVPSYGIYADKDWPEPQKGLAAMITRMDEGVGQILAKLEEHGITENTAIFFTSDNGPHREGGNDPDFFNSNGNLRGIKRDLYEGGIRVPLIVKWPKLIRGGKVSEHIAGFQDIFPTLATMADATAPADIDGISFYPLLSGQSRQQQSHDLLYWEFHERGGKQAVRKGPWKAIYFAGTQKLELYNLDDDPEETNDLSGIDLMKTIEMKSLMEQSHTPSSIWNRHEMGRIIP